MSWAWRRTSTPWPAACRRWSARANSCCAPSPTSCARRGAAGWPWNCAAQGRTAGPADRIEREGERLDALVGNTLALAKMGALPEPANMLDLAEVVDAVVEDARFEAGDRNVGIAWERPAPCASRATARAWPARSRTCCAMRCASRRRAAASACVCWRACATQLEIEDRGPGVPEQELAICSSPSTAAPRARPWRAAAPAWA